MVAVLHTNKPITQQCNTYLFHFHVHKKKNAEEIRASAQDDSYSFQRAQDS